MVYQNNKQSLAEDPAVRAWFMIFVLILCVGLMIYIDFNRRLWNPGADQLIAGRHWGNPQGELKITQFLDFQSPEAARGERMIFEFIQKHPNEVFLEIRYFPQDDLSLQIALHVECANAQKRIRSYLNLFYQRYSAWVGLADAKPLLNTIAQQINLNMKEFSACVVGDDAASIVALDRVYGESMFVKTTPSYSLNGKIYAGVTGLENALRQWDELLMHEE